MYFFMVAWMIRPVWHWLIGDWHGWGYVLLAPLMCLVNLFIFVFMGLSRARGLVTAIFIFAINIRFFW